MKWYYYIICWLTIKLILDIITLLILMFKFLKNGN